MKRTQAFSLGNTVVVIAVASTLAFTIAAASLNHLNYSNRVSNGMQAQNIAESTLAIVTERLVSDDSEISKLGKLREEGSSLTFDINGGKGVLTFNKEQAQNWKLPFSTNNLSDTNPIPGYDPTRPIPKNSAQLVARGTFGGVSRQVETILYIPPFPYAVATAGPFRSTGKLEVGALDVLLPPGQKPSPEDILSANLASNHSGTSALVIGPDSRVSGDVRSPGAVETDKTVYIGGQIRSGADPIAIPKENVTSYDPEATGKPSLQKMPPGSHSATTVAGFSKCSGDLNITGGLTLDSGVLYVDGNVSIDGGIKGKGALFVTKSLNLSGSTQMQTDNKVAVEVGGDVNIFGSGQESSLFQGMLYNEGAFKAQHITLMGVFIQNKEGATTEINDSALYYQSGQSKLEVNVGAKGMDISKGNVRVKPILSGVTGGVLGQSQAVFEAYPTLPVTDGKWELVDPNTSTIYTLGSKAAVEAKVRELWNNSTSGGLVGYGNGGEAAGPVNITVPNLDTVGPILENLLFHPQFDNLNSEDPRPPGSSKMLPSSGEKFTLDPSRFLSLKDRVRLLYWRAR